MRFHWPLISLFFIATMGNAADLTLQRIIHGPQRSKAFVERDAARHPLAELEFFGIKPDMSVVEILPSRGYWTEILAPYLRDRGTYYVAVPAKGNAEGAEGKDVFREKLSADPAVYGKVLVREMGRGRYDIAPPGSVDMVLTFRNVHNWVAGGFAEEVFAGFYRALKPGGILGVEDHRARTDVPQDPQAADGYVRQDHVTGLAKRAGFEFLGSSEINANPKDTKDWPKGVWTLPPSFVLGDQDRAKYAAIGEADNFVLKFRKPLK